MATKNPITQDVTMVDQTAKLVTHVRLKADGNINADLLGHDIKQHPWKSSISTTATECGWNVYASAKQSRSMQVSNRAQLIEAINNGSFIRVGNSIFLSSTDTAQPSHVSFSLSKFSSYIDSIDQQTRYLCVTSRQDIRTVPDPEDESNKDSSPESKSSGAPAEGANKDKSATEATSTSNVKATTVKPDATDDESSDDGSDGPPEPSEDEDNGQHSSAEESWSEASTEYDSDARIAEFMPQRPPQELVQGSALDSDDSDSDVCTASSLDSESDEQGLVEGGDKGSRRFNWEDDRDIYTTLFADDRNAPQSDEEDQKSDMDDGYDEPPGLWDDYDMLGDYQRVESDSEECSECGDDGACALPPPDTSAKPTLDKEIEIPVGTPLAQIRIYDTSILTGEKTPEPKQIFHFERVIVQTLYNSPPAFHPRESLLVWPLGDGKVLFADYRNNKYFVRKLPTSRFWSSHVAINCRFSKDGRYLHVAALEKSGSPPPRPVKKSKGQAKSEIPKSKEEDEPRYELIFSIYRMSKSKTTKVPPQLVGRVQRDLGQLTVLPSFTWNESCICVTATEKTLCNIYRVDFARFSTKGSKQTRGDEMSIRHVIVNLPAWALSREISFAINDHDSDKAELIVAAEWQKLPWYRAPKSDKPDESKQSTSSNEPDINGITKAPSTDVETASLKHGETVVNGKEDANLNGVLETKLETNLTQRENNTQDTDIGNPLTTDPVEDGDEKAAEDTASGNPNGTTNKVAEPENETKGKQSIHPGNMVALLNMNELPGGGWMKAEDVNSKQDVKGLDLTFQSLEEYWGV